MRLLLVQPDYARTAETGEALRAGLLPARPLIELGAVLEKKGHRVTVLDSLTALSITGDETRLDMKKALSMMLEQEKFDAVGVAVYTPVRQEARELAAETRRISRRMPVIAGGPHPARIARVMLKAWPEFDYACLGGAEGSLPRLLDSLSGRGGPVSRVSSLAYRVRGNIVRVNGRPVITADMAGLPPVRYDRYRERLPGGRIRRAYLMSARGCGHWCNFCSNIWKKVLPAEPEAVAAEAAHLVRDCGVEQIIFYDDCFGWKPDHARAVLEAVIRTGVEVELAAVTRFDLVEPGWLDLFVRAGGKYIFAGVESGSERLRRKMNKHMRAGELCRGAELIRSRGLKLGVFLLFGFPGELEEDIEETRRLLKKLEPAQVMSTIHDVKPGDVLFEFALTGRLLDPGAWNDEHRRIVNYLEREETEAAAARAVAFDRAFTREVIMPEHDPAGFIAGIESARLEALVNKEEERWFGNA